MHARFVALGITALVLHACGGSDDVEFTAPPAGGTGGQDGSATGGTAGSAGGAGTGGSSASGGVGGSAGTSTAGGAGGGAGTSGAGAAAGSAGAAGGGAAGAGGTSGGECTQATDCDGLFGAAPCGVWACNGNQCQASESGCVDADFDGYGTGSGCACAGLDCDDADDTIGDTAAGACYSGQSGTVGVGTCVAGTHSCAAGVWTPCSGEVTPSGEACNGLDDDCDGTDDDGLGMFSCGIGACVTSVAACTGGVVGVCTPPAGAVGDSTCDGIDDNCNGAIDEGCAASCIPVAKAFGNDTTAAALASPDLLTPFATIQAAIAYAVAHPSGPQTVCVAGGADCNANSSFAESVVMADGVSVLGSYQHGTVGNGWRGTPAVLGSRCVRPNLTTRIQPQSGMGVSFPSAVQSTTVLDGFQVDRFTASTTAAITLDGAKNVVLSNLILNVNVLGGVSNTYGVNLVNGAQALITTSHIEVGLGSVSAIGVRSIGSQANLLNNCSALNNSGRCGSAGGPSNSPGIRHGNGGAGITYGVYLESSPSSTVETTGIQMGNADTGAGVRIAGDATGTLLRGNDIFVFDGVVDSHGVWMEDCNGAAPWLVDNELLSGNGSNANARADGVRAIGDCHPVIDSNVRIQGGGEGNSAYPNGVHCGANSQSVPSLCVVLNNLLITGSQFGYPPVVTGVRCDGASCLRIAGNSITARGAGTGYGVWLESTGVMLDDNVIRGGCSATAYGVYSKDSYARVQNNRIFGYVGSDCTGAAVVASQSTGLACEIAAGLHEIDVNGNDIDGAGPSGSCSGRGISLIAGTPAPVSGSGIGIFRNNIVRAGACTTARYGVEEMATTTDPRIFENDDLDPSGSPTALYFDEASNPLTTDVGVNALSDMTVSGVISQDPQFVGYPADVHLQGTSLCIGAGTPTGAPAFDMEGDARDPVTPDIGADEH